MDPEVAPAAYARDEKNDTRLSEDSEVHILGAKSLGVKRIEAISAQFTNFDKILLFLSIFFAAYVYSLDNVVRYTYQPTATSDLSVHSLSATVSVARSVIAAAGQPVAAKISDVFGRVELIYFSIFFYILGTIVEATAPNLVAIAAGSILYQLGFMIIQLLVEVLIADITSLRSRLLASYLPPSNYLVNVWVSGNITSAVLGVTSWRWGFGMFGIIFPVAVMPLMIVLLLAGRRAKRNNALASFKTPLRTLGFARLSAELFWQLDIIGMLFIIVILGFILVPLTLAGGESSSWGTAHIIAPLVIGFLAIPPFIIWERKCKHPIIPFHLVKDRGVWGALGIALFLNFSWYMQGDYLYTMLVVAFDQSILSATRISSLYTFVSTAFGILIGIAVRFVKHLKWFIVFGACLWAVAFGLLIRYRGGVGGSNFSGVIGAQVLLGMAGGLFAYPAQASIQSCTKHEHVAVVTGLYLSVYYIGSALGNCVSGAYWTNTLPTRLAGNLAQFNNDTLVTYAYSSPFAFIADYPWGTPERDAVVNSYMETQKVLCIIGICLAVPLITFGLCTRNHTLGKEQSLKGAEVYAPSVTSSEENLERENQDRRV